RLRPPIVAHRDGYHCREAGETYAVGRPHKRGIAAHGKESDHAEMPIVVRLDCRTRISVRIRMIHNTKNSSVYPSAMRNSGHKNTGAINGPPARKMLSPWCSVVHQSTENSMTGRFTAPTSASTAQIRAARVSSSMAFQRAM